MKKSIILLAAAMILTAAAAGCKSNAEKSESSSASAADQTSAAVIDSDTASDYEVREIYCDNNGKKIYGEAYIPKGGGRFTTVLTSHGLGSNHESGASYAKKYAPKGYAVYTFDFCGGSNTNNENKSDGSPLEMSVMTEVSDLEAVLSAAKSWEFVDPDRIYLQGGSQGGLVSAITGIKHQDEIAGMILLYPAFGMYDLVCSFDDETLEDEIQVGSMTVGKNFVTDLRDYDVREHLYEFTKPVLVLQGSEDGTVLPEFTEEATKLFPDAEYYVIEGAGHGFSGEHHDEASKRALGFLGDKSAEKSKTDS